jgi:hypothetical protein
LPGISSLQSGRFEGNGKLVQKGRRAGQRQFHISYAYGWETAKDDALARKWMTKASGLNDHDATRWLVQNPSPDKV